MTHQPPFRCNTCDKPARWQRPVDAEDVSTVAACDDCKGTDPLLLPVVGHGMLATVHFVADRPGCTMRAVARVVGPHGSQQHGYEIVHRAIRAGLIHRRGTASRSELHLTPLGQCIYGTER